MPGGAGINRRTAVGIVLRDMRRAAALTAAGDKVGGVVVSVAALRAAGPGIIRDSVIIGVEVARLASHALAICRLTLKIGPTQLADLG
jgi:hypothetical protein